MGRGDWTGSRTSQGPAQLPRLIEASFAQLQEDMVRYLRAVAGADVAEDVASQVWVEVVGRASEFQGDEAALRRLVFATARRRALDQHRRWWRRKVNLHPPGDRVLEQAASEDPEVVHRDRAVTWIARLPRAQAEVVLLRVIGDLSTDEVAQMTGRSPGAVRVLQHRALRRLASDLRRVRGDV
ncbi:MAG TPA: RNA polymerase sigma factor [Gaiellales bacterium]|nr:RNA polymerase sigma factor [Gaiellales bacterium]